MDDDEKSVKNKLIIEGIDSQTGKKFRPADWAERMSGALSTSQDKTWKALKKKSSTRVWVPYAKAGLTAVLDNLRLEKVSASSETILDTL